MKLRTLLAALVLTTASAAPAAAHHSFAAMFDANKPIRLVGKLTRVEWTNPHSYFHLDVTDSKGRVNTWACEGAGPGALSRRGFSRSSIRIGDTITVDGYLAKSGARLIDARRILLPDGRVVSGGTPGDGGPGSAAAPTATQPR